VTRLTQRDEIRSVVSGSCVIELPSGDNVVDVEFLPHFLLVVFLTHPTSFALISRGLADTVALSFGPPFTKR